MAPKENFKSVFQSIIALVIQDSSLNSPLQLFLENNGRVDVFDHQGRSALHMAAENGSIEVMMK